MPRITPYPVPKKRYHGSRWRIYWKWNRVQYSITTDYFDEKKTSLLDADFRKISAALSEDSPSFPEKYENDPVVIKYITARYPSEQLNDVPDSGTILAEYDKKNSMECGEIWARNSRSRLTALAEMADGILNVTPKIADQFLTGILNAGNKPATRNRALVVCNKFFKEMVRIGYIKSNPFTGIKQLKEVRDDIITYCTAEECTRVLDAAMGLGSEDWLAIPIAIYAGCRREEIFTLRWEDVNFSTKRLVVHGTKTGKRTTPIKKELLTLFEEHKKSRGRVVPPVADETWQNQADRLIEGIRDILCCPENPNLAGKASEAKGKKKYVKKEESIKVTIKAAKKQIRELTEKVIASDKSQPDSREMAVELVCLESIVNDAHDGKTWIPAERIGWNAFRHTFATLRAQAGVSLDKISSWMGNTYSVCKTHYAQFMPRDSHDDDIDR